MVLCAFWRSGIVSSSRVDSHVEPRGQLRRRFDQEVQQKTAAGVIEYAGGITTLQAYGQAGSAFERLQKDFGKLRDDSKRQEKAGGAVSAYGRAILFSGIGIVMGVGAYLLSKGEISPFFYVMCLLAAMQVYEPIMQLFVFVISMARINQCVEKLIRLKEERALEVREPVMETSGSDVAFENVHFAYGSAASMRRFGRSNRLRETGNSRNVPRSA